MQPVIMIVYRTRVLMTTDTVAAASPSPVTRNLSTSAALTKNTRNWIGASIPWTRVHREASRLNRSSFVYNGIVR
jgi:hypothetical protein